ncbi:3'-phosphoesterase [Candidatus Parcubacteria bacterium]|nr:3'-phosphoesterase [Candidatus Parcubacteria bacterium]
MTLGEYQRKRKFTETTEPEGKGVRASRNRFVVQKHQATRLHYDFRLELPEEISGGEIVLKSWAVPKGPPMKKGEKRLAVMVEDHPVAYLNFEGTIPEGHYGAGTVEIWDSGTFKLLERRSDLLEFELAGQKLSGKYSLVHPQKFEKDSWLLIKN